MKLVTFNRAMAPYNAGESCLVPDEVAAQLRADGVLGKVEDFPPRAPSGVPVVAAKPKLSLPRRQSYQTK